MKKSFILELASKRVSIRKFSKKKISFKKILGILEVARQAPSGANTQPWRFIIIDDLKLKKNIRKICERIEKNFHKKAPLWLKNWLKNNKISYSKPFLIEAPYLIVVISNKKFPYFKESTWIAIGYMLLAIEEIGLATLTYTPSNTEILKRILNIPSNYSLEAILPIGYPLEKKNKDRKKLSEIIFYNKYGLSLSI